MPNPQFKFLEERLSEDTTEYLDQISRNFQEVLNSFDALVLGGYSTRREEELRLKEDSGYLEVISDSLIQHQIKGKPLYEMLLRNYLSVSQEKREVFLYALRTILLYYQEKVQERLGASHALLRESDILGVSNKYQLSRPSFYSLLYSASMNAIEEVAPALKDTYRLMIDIIRQKAQSPLQP